MRRSCAEKANSAYNFAGIDGRDPLVSASLYLNNQARWSKPGPYFRLVQPYQHHTNVPDEASVRNRGMWIRKGPICVAAAA